MKEKRIVAFDILNILACFAVVFLHQNGASHRYKECIGWDIALGSECLFYFAVPIFFMLSGASLMRYDERYSTRVFFKKRLKRTLIPFILWSLVGLFISLSLGKVTLNDISFNTVIEGFLNTQFQPVYWFFIPLFTLYALVPLLVLAKDKRLLVKYLIILLFIFISCYPLYCKLTHCIANTYISSAIFGPLLYFLSGYYIFRWGIRKKYYYLILVLGAVSLVCRYAVTWYLSTMAGETVKLLYGYFLPTGFFLSISVFLIILKIRWKVSCKRQGILAELAASSLGVYLIHQYLITAEIHAVNHWGLNEYSPVFLIIFPFITWGVSMAIVTLIKKIKIGRLIFP